MLLFLCICSGNRLQHRCLSILLKAEILLCPMTFVLMHSCTIDGNRTASSNKLKCQPWQRWASRPFTASPKWVDGPSVERFLIKRQHFSHTPTRTTVRRAAAYSKKWVNKWGVIINSGYFFRSFELCQIFPEQGAFATVHIDFMQCAWRSEMRWDEDGVMGNRSARHTVNI